VLLTAFKIADRCDFWNRRNKILFYFLIADDQVTFAYLENAI